jgi:murein DD-endopeptidase MepM/ murein hydrolase activator NlpD
MKALLCCFFVCLPLKHLYLTSAFGYRVNPMSHKYRLHSGTDFRAHSDTVYTIISGAANAGYDTNLGIYIRVVNNDLQVIYGHLSRVLKLDSVKAGEPVAITGATGRVTGEHLHLAIKYRGQAIDPLKFLYELMLKQNTHEQ